MAGILRMRLMIGIFVGLIAWTASTRAADPSGPLGIFEAHQDIGPVLHAGAAEFDDAKKIFAVTGSGTNLWNATDEFRFVWKKVSGDVSLAADVSILNVGTEPHRKGCGNH